MARDKNCNRERLKLLLHESLPAAAEREVADHVSSCTNCQRDLEAIAAGEQWWSEASQRLSRSSIDEIVSTASHGLSDDDAAHFASDFAVDFLEPSDDPKMLGRLGDYEIVEVIGRGGMGIVLKGFQKELHRYVAVKVMSPHLATSGAARRRFAREAQATAAVVHPHVMPIHSVHANAKLPYLVMTYVECQSLQERIDKQGPFDTKDILRIGMQAALGLSAAHAQGIVHRDVKPANILLETNVDRVLLTDFGLARAVDDATLTRTGIIAGTPQYMSPEQANGESIDHRSDIFSLGGVLYAMCTARPPFRAETTFGVLRRIRETPPRSIREINPEIPEWLERIVLKLLEKQTDNRFSTAEDVAVLLEQCLAHVQQPTLVKLPHGTDEWKLQPPAESAVRQAVTNHSIAWVTGVVAILLIVTSSAWYFSQHDSLITRMEAEPRQEMIPVLVPSESDAPDAVEPAQNSVAELDLSTKQPLNWDATEYELNEAFSLIDELEDDVDDLDPNSPTTIPREPKEEQ